MGQKKLNKARLGVYIHPEIISKFKELAIKERRSLSNLLEVVMQDRIDKEILCTTTHST